MRKYNREHKDIAGMGIAVGDYICYAALWSRSAVLKFGRVASLKFRDGDYVPEEKRDPNKTYLRYGLEKEGGDATIGVITVDRQYNWKDDKTTWEIQAKGRLITLGFLDRLMVVDESYLPKDARDILDTHFEK